MIDKTASDRDWSAASDAELVEAYQSSDQSVFVEIDRRFRPRLFRYLRSRAKRTDIAEELTQETLMRASSALPTLRDGVFLPGWLKKIAYRVYVDWLRRASREEAHLSYDENGCEDGSQSATPSSKLRRPNGAECVAPAADELSELRDECDNIWRIAWRTLSPLEFQVLWLRYADDLKDEEAARSLGRSPGSVRTALSRARRRLAEALNDTGLKGSSIDESSSPSFNRGNCDENET